MKTLVGVDLAGEYTPALETCLELDFPNQEFLFVNVVEVTPSYAPPMEYEVLDTGCWIKHLKAAGESAVTRAEARACRSHLQSTSRVIIGSPAETLTTLAEGESADLIVVGSTQRTGISGFIMGSVGRALAIGSRKSILATKAKKFPKRPLKAIFATDHSDYANRALEKLMEWAPKGIGQIDVLSAYEVSEGYVIAIPENIIDSGETVESIIRGKLEKLTEDVVQTLSKAGYQSKGHVVRGYPNAVIGGQMKELDADILVIGAQGHGFLERLLVGSTALHQMLNEPYPLLIIRP